MNAITRKLYGKNFYLYLSYVVILHLRPFIKKIHPHFRYILKRDIPQAISIWTLVMIVIKLLVRNEILALILTAVIVVLILEFFQRVRRIVEKYDSSALMIKSEDIWERLKKLPLETLICPTAEERIEAANEAAKRS